MSEQPEGVIVVDNEDGVTQTIYATATLQAAVTTGNEDAPDADPA